MVEGERCRGGGQVKTLLLPADPVPDKVALDGGVAMKNATIPRVSPVF